jgi:uncharacterized protein
MYLRYASHWNSTGFLGRWCAGDQAWPAGSAVAPCELHRLGCDLHVAGRNAHVGATTHSMNDALQTEIEAAAFRRLVAHFQQRTDVQNLDVMNLAGFCRNCLSKWYRAAAAERGHDMTDADARERIYGMPYDQWKATFQK